MDTKSRRNCKNSKTDKRGDTGNELGREKHLSPVQGRAAATLREGITDIGGTIRLALGAAEDMLNGVLTPQEATVVTTAVGRALKGVEIQLKYADRNNRQVPLALPSLQTNG